MEVMSESKVMQLNDRLLFRQQCYLDGQWIDASDQKTTEVTDPATGARIGVVPALGKQETRRAIEAAESAWPSWRARTGKDRARLMRTWFELILENREDLAQLMTIK